MTREEIETIVAKLAQNFLSAEELIKNENELSITIVASFQGAYKLASILEQTELARFLSAITLMLAVSPDSIVSITRKLAKGPQ